MFEFIAEPQASLVRGRTSWATYPSIADDRVQRLRPATGVPRRCSQESQRGLILTHVAEAWASTIAKDMAASVAHGDAARPLGWRLS